MISRHRFTSLSSFALSGGKYWSHFSDEETEIQGDHSCHKRLSIHLLGVRLGVPWLRGGLCDIYLLPAGGGRMAADKRARFQIPVMFSCK